MMLTSWQFLLSDVTYDEAKAATAKMIRNGRYPSVAALMENVRAIRSKDIPTAEEAWTEVSNKLDPYKTPVWSTKTIKEAVRVMGYKQLLTSENPGMDRSQFFKIYNNLLTRNIDKHENEVVSKLIGGISAKIGQIGEAK